MKSNNKEFPSRRSRNKSQQQAVSSDVEPALYGFEPCLSGANSSRITPSASLLDIFIPEACYSFENHQPALSNASPRSFSFTVKQQCWEKSEKIKGRDPDRWRRDALGNIVFRKLVGCPGCLCYDYDHVIPYSKGGQSIVENCQILQATVNRSKGNRTEISKDDLTQRSSYCRVAGREMDLLELAAFGNVRRGQESGGCRIQ